MDVTKDLVLKELKKMKIPGAKVKVSFAPHLVTIMVKKELVMKVFDELPSWIKKSAFCFTVVADKGKAIKERKFDYGR